MTTGQLYGIGVGPGDPELMTMKGVRILREADIIAAPESGEAKNTALQIAAQWIENKPLLLCQTPMLRDKQRLAENYDKIADQIEAHLKEGKTVAFLTLGDPSVYSTYIYIHQRILARGYHAELVPGVPSFCAVAAKLNMPLCEGSQMLHIIPASHESTQEGLKLSGNKVLMKAGRGVRAVYEQLKQENKLSCAAMVERCGMEQERIYHTLEDFQGDAGYFSVIVVKEEA